MLGTINCTLHKIKPILRSLIYILSTSSLFAFSIFNTVGHFDVVKVLVLNGKDRIEIKKKNWMGKTPLEEAKENKHHTIVHFLEAVEAEKNVHVE